MDNYYDYEYDVIKRLSEIFKFTDVSINQYKYDYVYDYKKYPITSIGEDKYLILNFKNINWKYLFNRNIISDAFNDNIPVRDVVNKLKKDIEYRWLKEIKNDN